MEGALAIRPQGRNRPDSIAQKFACDGAATGGALGLAQNAPKPPGANATGRARLSFSGRVKRPRAAFVDLGGELTRRKATFRAGARRSRQSCSRLPGWASVAGRSPAFSHCTLNRLRCDVRAVSHRFASGDSTVVREVYAAKVRKGGGAVFSKRRRRNRSPRRTHFFAANEGGHPRKESTMGVGTRRHLDDPWTVGRKAPPDVVQLPKPEGLSGLACATGTPWSRCWPKPLNCGPWTHPH